MSLLKKGDQKEAKPLDDIIEGVDIIGTMINDMLPQVVEDVADMKQRLDDLSEHFSHRLPAGGDSAEDLSDISERIELLEQRYLAHEQTSLDRYSDLKEELSELRMSLSSLHDKLDELAAFQTERR